MSAPAKFLFDTDFGRGGSRSPGSASVQQQATIAEAEQRGYRNGFAAATAELSADTQRRTATALTQTAASLEALMRGLRTLEERLEAEAVQVAYAVAGKLAPALMAREPFAEVAALAAECFRHLIGAPHVVVRVDDAVYETARAQLQEIAAGCGFDGRLVVLAEPDLKSGDCRIEWADGGVVRDRAATEAAIVDAVGRYLAVRGASQPAFGVSNDADR